MTPSTRSIMVNLIISNNRNDHHQNVTQDNRGELQRHLTHVLVNDVTLSKHRDFLKSFKYDRPQLPAETVNSIPNTGLDCLNNHEIAVLALDPIALDNLYETIDQCTPDAWTHDINLEGLKRVEVYQRQYEKPNKQIDNQDD